ncbi:MAG: DUF3360 domain-containing protein [Clostridiales bacterium]|nr:DUF3360 domain-containing protein [Clostridiales bacterium]
MAIGKNSSQRKQALDQDLATWKPRSWAVNLPFRDYSIRPEDMIPAFAGAIGKVSLVAAFAVAWEQAYAIRYPGFVAENIRLEMVVASLILLISSACLLPRAAPPGTLTPLIPMVPLMAAAGVHPLTLGLAIGLLGLLLAVTRTLPRIVALNTAGTRGGILMLFGLLGLNDSTVKLIAWSDPVGWLLPIALLTSGLAGYLLLTRWRKAYLTVPVCLVAALAVSAAFGRVPQLTTSPGLPMLDFSWWSVRWQLPVSFGVQPFLAALPFAALAVVMWPLDATAIMTMHEQQYKPYEQKAVFDLNQTFLVVSLRQLIGVVLGGAQVAAVWRSFLIPLGVVRRPIPGAALLLALFSLGFAFAGYPIDIAMYAPILHLVLVFGVYVPMLLSGVKAIRRRSDWLVAALVLTVGIALHPLAGWLLGIASGQLARLKLRRRR